MFLEHIVYWRDERQIGKSLYELMQCYSVFVWNSKHSAIDLNDPSHVLKTFCFVGIEEGIERETTSCLVEFTPKKPLEKLESRLTRWREKSLRGSLDLNPPPLPPLKIHGLADWSDHGPWLARRFGPTLIEWYSPDNEMSAWEVEENGKMSFSILK